LPVGLAGAAGPVRPQAVFNLKKRPEVNKSGETDAEMDADIEIKDGPVL
jgi:hypothetical protein